MPRASQVEAPCGTSMSAYSVPLRRKPRGTSGLSVRPTTSPTLFTPSSSVYALPGNCTTASAPDLSTNPRPATPERW